MPADGADPALFREGADQVLDPAALRELRSGGAQFFREIADLFCSETPAQIGRIGQALESGDLESVKREVHSLKGASLSMGARRISAVCIQIEEAAKQRAPARARQLASDLAKEYERARDRLQVELKH